MEFAESHGWRPSSPLDVPDGEPGLACSRAGVALLCLRWDDSPMREARAAARRAGLSERRARREGLLRFPDCSWRLGLYYGDADPTRCEPTWVDWDGVNRDVHERNVAGVAPKVERWDREHHRPVSSQVIMAIQPRSYIAHRDAWSNLTGLRGDDLPVMRVTLDEQAIADLTATSVPRAYYLLGLTPVETRTRYVPAIAMSELLMLTTVYDFDVFTATSTKDLREVPAWGLPAVIDAYRSMMVKRAEANRLLGVALGRTRESTDPVRGSTARTTFNGKTTTRPRPVIPPSKIHAPANTKRRGRRFRHPTMQDLLVKVWHPTSN
ncbi:hypothetical protein [Bifidobacterium olomucense]|uniref:hypothetical protein n=1 Tax=Bifidobacterium olomucense TaxID=2675324 RepID=UPI00145DE180|nr:hypothetical protein [Bifidobacterium sp. DSM 109959]